MSIGENPKCNFNIVDIYWQNFSSVKRMTLIQLLWTCRQQSPWTVLQSSSYIISYTVHQVMMTWPKLTWLFKTLQGTAADYILSYLDGVESYVTWHNTCKKNHYWKTFTTLHPASRLGRSNPLRLVRESVLARHDCYTHFANVMKLTVSAICFVNWVTPITQPCTNAWLHLNIKRSQWV